MLIFCVFCSLWYLFTKFSTFIETNFSVMAEKFSLVHNEINFQAITLHLPKTDFSKEAN